VFVATGDQIEVAISVAASMTTERLVAQETINPKAFVCTPKPGLLRIRGFGRNHAAVGRAPKVEDQPAVPGK
jgi:hypothetical protein